MGETVRGNRLDTPRGAAGAKGTEQENEGENEGENDTSQNLGVTTRDNTPVPAPNSESGGNLGFEVPPSPTEHDR